MHIETEGIVCGVRAHGEHGTMLRVLTPEHGLIAAYVRGGRGRHMRPVLIPGNLVSLRLRSRTDAQLPQATVELIHSRASILAEPLPASAIEWSTAIVTTALPERQPYPRLYEGLSGLLDAIEAASAASGWGIALARFEILLLAELGYGRETSSLHNKGLGKALNEWTDVLAALETSGKHLIQETVAGRSHALHDSRSRLLDRLRRAAS